MKYLLDTIVTFILLIYLIWICYYRLYAIQNSAVIKQLFFLFEGIAIFVVLGRLFLEKRISIEMGKARHVVFVVLCFKAFQIIYRVFKISPNTKIYMESNNDVIWSVVGAVLIFVLLGIPLIKTAAKWVKN